MSRVAASLSDGKRTVVAVALLALVHLFLLKNGSENATPQNLALSFALSTALLITAQLLRRRLQHQGSGERR